MLDALQHALLGQVVGAVVVPRLEAHALELKVDGIGLVLGAGQWGSKGVRSFMCACMCCGWMPTLSWSPPVLWLWLMMMEVQEARGKVASAEASKEAGLTASPDEEMIQEVFRHRHLCSSQKAL